MNMPPKRIIPVRSRGAVVTKTTATKATIPKALREQVWIQGMGRSFEGKCRTTWCTNQITVFDFQCGHNIPECKGGQTSLTNLVPICSRCNQSMGSQYTFDEWCAAFHPPNARQPPSLSLSSSPPSPSPSPPPPPPPPPPTCWQAFVRFFCGFNRNGQAVS
jgi:hypothetical protein